MARLLPRLRANLDLMPSPVEDRPGLLIRDSLRYSDTTLIIPPALAPCLEAFDGQRTDLDLRAALVSLTGDLRVGELVDNMVETLSQAGFLEDEAFARLRDERHKTFAEAPQRLASHAGSAYPEEPELLRSALAQYLDGALPRSDSLAGIAAPHISPDGGWESYRDAYGALGPHYRDRVFVILGTSHFGEPERFGLTRKPFLTPLGEARTEQAPVDWLATAAPDAVNMEDYCHAIEHSIEFQVVFLQQVFGPDIRMLPILCGPYARNAAQGGRPEENPHVARFIEALGELAAREGERLFWVLGVDMAHMGRRYGDPFSVRAEEGQMSAVARTDRQRIACITAGDADGFWQLVQENQDDLKWCGSSAFYTFLKALPDARGSLIRYQQWNIDEHSVVSFGALAFTRA